MSIEKAIEFIKNWDGHKNGCCLDILRNIERSEPYCSCGYEKARKQALDELSKQSAERDLAKGGPEPSEFTKYLRPLIEDDGFSQQDVKEACDIIDRQQARIKELEKQNADKD